MIMSKKVKGFVLFSVLLIIAGFLFSTKKVVIDYISKNMYLVDQGRSGEKEDLLQLNKGAAFRQAFRPFYDYLYKVYLAIEMRNSPEGGYMVFDIVDDDDKVYYSQNISAKELSSLTGTSLTLLVNKKVKKNQRFFLKCTSFLDDGAVGFPIGKRFFDARVSSQAYANRWNLFATENGQWLQKKGILQFQTYSKVDLSFKNILDELARRIAEEKEFLFFYSFLVMAIGIRISLLNRHD